MKTQWRELKINNQFREPEGQSLKLLLFECKRDRIQLYGDLHEARRSRSSSI